MAAFALLLLASLALHPGSLSRSRVTVTGNELHHDLRFHALTMIETLPLDGDLNLRLDAKELDSGRAEIERYLLEHYEFFAKGLDAYRLSGKLTSLSIVLEGPPEVPTSYWIEAALDYSQVEPIESLILVETLFEESNPNHVDYLSIAWNGEYSQNYVFQPSERTATFAPTGIARKGELRVFFEMGTMHILSGYDHLLFLVALLAAVASLRSLALVITAFTLSHSITLAVASMQWFELPSRFVELAIALSIVYVAAENLMKLERRSLWLEAFLFGLLHGLGFAGFLGDALQAEESIAVPLIGFNLGVEFGQLLVVLPIACVFALWARRHRARDLESEKETPLLVPRPLARFASIVIVVIGLYWFVERAGFIS